MATDLEFVRERFSGTGMMFLFCVGCGRLIAYGPRADVLNIAEAAHRKVCANAQLQVQTSPPAPATAPRDDQSPPAKAARPSGPGKPAGKKLH